MASIILLSSSSPLEDVYQPDVILAAMKLEAGDEEVMSDITHLVPILALKNGSFFRKFVRVGSASMNKAFGTYSDF